MTTTEASTSWAVELTASPLQRVGAFALAGLVNLEHPQEFAPDSFERAVETMTAHLLGTAGLAKAGDTGGYWLSASYLLWPNSPLNPTNRGRQTVAQRRAAITAWRTRPDAASAPDAPCVYCGRPACGWYGKVDIPLGASVAYRNTTAHGHQGTPLCYPCLACLWAFPYGARLSGGRAAVIHSWDDDFLGAVTRRVLRQTSRLWSLGMPKGVKSGPYERELAVLREIGDYGLPLRAPVELMVLSNSNKEQFLDVQEMGQPVAEWLRSTVNTRHAAGYRALVETQGTQRVPGEAFLAKRAFSDPVAVLDFAVRHVARGIGERALLPPVAPELGRILHSYCREVLSMEDKDVQRVVVLAERVAGVLGATNSPGPFREFIRANGRGGSLNGWFRARSVDGLLDPKRPGDAPAFLATAEYRLLFEDERSWHWRQLLLYRVIEELIRAGWRPQGADEELEEIKEAAGQVANKEDVER